MKTIQPPSKSKKVQQLYFAVLFLLLSFAGNIQRADAQCRTAIYAFPDSSGYSIQFYDSSTGGTPLTWAWDFGDGGTSTQQSPLHTYANTGYYQVCLTVDFVGGCTVTYCDSVYAGPGSSQCAANYTFMSSGGTVFFTDMSSGGSAAINSWDWDFGDGGTSTSANPTHTYTSSGTYTVCLTITTAGGLCSNMFCSFVTVQISSGCGAGYGFSNQAGQLNVSFFDSSYTGTGLITSWFWDFGDSTSSTLQNPTHTYSTYGIYQVCLTITSSTGCSDTYCYGVDVRGPFCYAGFYPNTGSALQVTFSDQSNSSSTITGWSWDFGDGGNSTLQNPIHSYTAGGYYNVCLTISTNTGCTDSRCDSIYVSSTTSCQSAFTYQVNGSTVDFQDNSVPFYHTGIWDFGDGNTTTSYPGQSVSHQYFNTGTYLVCLTITDSLCTSTTCDTVVVSQAGCSAQFSTINDSLNYLLVYFFDLSPGQITSWAWDFGDGGTSSQQHPTHLYSGIGTYRVCLTVFDSINQCTSTFCDNVNALSPCAPNFGAYPDSLQQTTVNMNFWMMSNCGTPSAIFWDFGDGTFDSTGVLNPMHAYADTGTYNVCACVVIGVDTFCNCQPVYAYRLISGVQELTSLVHNLKAYPNPFHEKTEVRFDLSQPADIELSVVDILGNTIESVYKGKAESGDHSYGINGQQLSPGIYFIRLDVNGNVKTQKIFFLP